MDKYYINEVIRRIEQEKSVHDDKFVGNPLHKDCLPRFDDVLDKLNQELARLEETNSRADLQS